jgi:energy-coupling factor transport system ATP-binding protein
MRCINGLIPEAYHGEMTGDILLYGESVRGKTLADISQNVGTLLQDPERQSSAHTCSMKFASGWNL